MLLSGDRRRFVYSYMWILHHEGAPLESRILKKKKNSSESWCNMGNMREDYEQVTCEKCVEFF